MHCIWAVLGTPVSPIKLTGSARIPQDWGVWAPVHHRHYQYAMLVYAQPRVLAI